MEKNYCLIPEPKNIAINNEKYCCIPYKISSDCVEFAGVIKAFVRCAKKIHNVNFTIGEGGIHIITDAVMPKETYAIEVDAKIVIKASSSKGAGYALATMLQLMKVSNLQVVVPYCNITDYPDKEYRSLMLDLSREWHPFKTLLAFVDLCFLLKVSYLHLHFIDNERYTLPSRIYPELPEKDESYTWEEIELLNQYACEASVELVPEFECPGHSVRMIERLPDIFLNDIEGEATEFINELGVSMGSKQSIVCAGKEETYKALENIVDEICELFPHSKYIHIGGDEAQLDIWGKCNTCKKYMEEKGISTVGRLYSHFIARITNMVLGKGRIPIVWEGFPEEGCEQISRDVVVCAWESHYFLPHKLLDAGFTVINGSWQPLYIVNSIRERWNAYDVLKWNVYNWQHWWEKSYATLNPITVEPTDNVIGGQISSWECTYEQEFPFVIENLSALSERTWNVERRCTDQEFYKSFTYLVKYAVRVLQVK